MTKCFILFVMQLVWTFGFSANCTITQQFLKFPISALACINFRLVRKCYSPKTIKPSNFNNGSVVRIFWRYSPKTVHDTLSICTLRNHKSIIIKKFSESSGVQFVSHYVWFRVQFEIIFHKYHKNAVANFTECNLC